MKEFFDAENRRVEFLDERFYQSDCGEHYYPSVTRVLDNLPKGPQFYMWMKDVGHNASLIAERAANEGTNVHDALERMMKGDEINWMDERGKAIYNKTEWQCILQNKTSLWTVARIELAKSGNRYLNNHLSSRIPLHSIRATNYSGVLL